MKMIMGLSENEIKPLLVRSLTHYESRLKESQEDPDILKLGIEMVKNDLEKNIQDSAHIRQFLDQILKESTIPLDDRKIICLSLSCYIEDLKATIETTKSKLGKLNLQFNEIQAEIDKGDELRNKICPSDWNWVSA